VASLLYRIGRFSVRRRRWVLAIWLVLLVGVAVAGSALGGSTSNSLSIPGTESQRAIDLLNKRFPAAAVSSAQVVFAAPAGMDLNQPRPRAVVESTIASLAKAAGVSGVTDPYATNSVSPDAHVAFASVSYPTQANDVTDREYQALKRVADQAKGRGVQIELGGEVITAKERGTPSSSEAVGLLVAVVVLLFAFGSVLAMGLPLLTALIGLGIGLSGITLLSAVTELSDTAPVLATMIGLAVGIDYALFIITRHRQNLTDGLDVPEAAAHANATAGSSVVFAGATVVIAISSLAVVGIPVLTVMGLAAAATVAIAVVVAITLLPAMLGFAGTNIDRFKVPGLRARTGGLADGEAWGSRWARSVTRRPVLGLAAGLLVMGILAIPVLDIRLGITDASSLPRSSTQRRAYDLLAEAFGPGFNAPLNVVVDLTHLPDPASATSQVATAIQADPGVAKVGTPRTSANEDTAALAVTAKFAPASANTEALVHRLRGNVFSAIEKSTGARIAITGSTAINIDLSEKISGALPLFMALVIGLTILLLMVVFRSVLVPIKAALAILVSIAASFGVIVAVFQWGWLKDVIGLEETIPIVSFLPMFMFAILFGLSMDYEVFILTRIREEYVHGDTPERAVLAGLSASARVITAAALIMISVFAGFALGDEPTIKMFGVGLSVAVLLDATVVRMLIVPAAMTLFGQSAWWLPNWLDRLLPHIDVEGANLDRNHGNRLRSSEANVTTVFNGRGVPRWLQPSRRNASPHDGRP
jgi:putative drug exporter of the RND superfamily